MGREAAKFDPADFAVGLSEQLDTINRGIELMGKILGDIKSQEVKTAKKKVTTAVPNGDTLQFDFDVSSIYVDNSQSNQIITIRPQGKTISFQVAANSTGWIHPLGGKFFDVTGTGTVAGIMAVETFLPIK